MVLRNFFHVETYFFYIKIFAVHKNNLVLLNLISRFFEKTAKPRKFLPAKIFDKKVVLKAMTEQKHAAKNHEIHLFAVNAFSVSI